METFLIFEVWGSRLVIFLKRLSWPIMSILEIDNKRLVLVGLYNSFFITHRNIQLYKKPYHYSFLTLFL